MWLAHMLRQDWRCIGALSENGALIGISYGYRGASGQCGTSRSAGACWLFRPVVDAERTMNCGRTCRRSRPGIAVLHSGRRAIHDAVVDDREHVPSVDRLSADRFRIVLRDYLFARRSRPFASSARNCALE